MFFSCGTSADFDHWAEVTGDSAWNAENMFKNLKEFTNVEDEELMKDPECQKYLGTNGPLTVSFFNDSNPIEEPPILIRAGEAAGYEVLKDINCGKWKGFVQFRGTIKNGERNSAARAFLAPMRNKRNLMIMRNSFVKKLIIKDGEIEGVLVQTERPECKEFEVHANLEVIVSAGVFNSPGILLRSGIGRKEDLDEINVTQILDLPVGHNYKDHIQTWHYLAIPATPQSPQTSDPNEDYLLRRRGPMSHLSSEDTHVYFNLNGDGPYPDVQWDVFYEKAGGFNIEMTKYFANIKDEYFTVLSKIFIQFFLFNFFIIFSFYLN
jgi:choline dehydrogenase